MKLKKQTIPNIKAVDKGKKSLPAIDMQKVLDKGSSTLSEGVAVLTYADKKKMRVF